MLGAIGDFPDSESVPVWGIGFSAEGSSSVPLAPQHLRLISLQNLALRTPVLRLRLTGVFDAARLHAASKRVLREHVALRRCLIDDPAGGRLWTADGVASVYSGDSAHVLRLDRHDDRTHVLTLAPGVGAVDGVGLLRAAEAIAAVYRSPDISLDTGPAPESMDEFFAGLLTAPGAEPGGKHWREYDRALTAAHLARAMVFPPASSGPRVTVPLTEDSRLGAGVLSMARATETAVDAVLLTAWRLLLARIAPEEDGSLAVYTPGPVEQVPNTIGLLGRYVPFPLTSVGAGGSVGDAFRDCQNLLEEARLYGDFFVHPSPGAGYSAGFRHLNGPSEFPLGRHSRAVVDTIRAPTDDVTVELQCYASGEDVRLLLEVDSAVVDLLSARRLGGWLTKLLVELPAALDVDADQAVEGILEPPRQKKFGRRVMQGDGGTLIHAFERRAALGPDAPAARDDRVDVSYRALLGASATIAQSLAARGVVRGDSVAVCMSRRVPLLASLLAVMRRGAYFVPIDPVLSISRVADILEDADPVLIVADTEGARALRSVENHPTLRVDSMPPSCPPEEDENGATPSELAYLIYTSGSTGRPKGVPITHGALWNYLRWASSRYDTAAGGGTLVHSSISVDLTVTSLFLPLLTGRMVTFVPSDEPQALAAALNQVHELSPFKTTPSGLRLLTSLMTGPQLASAVRHLVLGGEQLTASVLGGVSAPGLPVTNEYGPTEATVGCCAYTFRLGDEVPDPVPIGRPIWNTAIEVQTGDGRAAFPGTSGEIVIFGAGVARGYHQRPDDTAARFVADSDESGRGYRTGDLAVFHADGNLEMLGRIDDQLKIHGYRVEPGEIEAVLTADPLITAAAVVLTGPSQGSSVLSAFLVPANSHSGEAVIQRGRSLVMQRLPFYARPDRFQVVAELPLQVNGKVDRRALAALESAPEDGRSPSVSDPRIALIVGLWRSVLGSMPSGPDSNFFAEGGDSIKAVLLATQAQRAGLHVTVHDVLEQRTLERIAASAHSRSCARHTPRLGPIPLTSHQAGFFATDPPHPQRWALRWVTDAPMDLDPARLQAALDAVIRSHPALWSTFAKVGGRWTARLTKPGPTPLHVFDLSDTTDSDRERVVQDRLVEHEDTMDLASVTIGLLLFRDHRLGRCRVAWSVHHLITDLVSLQVMTDELWHVYNESDASPVDGADDGYLEWLSTTERALTAFPALSERAGTSSVLSTFLGESVSRALEMHRNEAMPRWGIAALAAALLNALSDLRPDLPSALCVELHGRDRPGHDLASAVGWLTEFRPLHVGRGVLADTSALTASIHLQLQRTAPLSHPLPPVALNYVGDLPAGCDLGLPVGLIPGSVPLFPLEVVCWTQTDGMQVRWRHSCTWMPAPVVHRLAEAFAKHLRVTLALPPGERVARSPSHLNPADLHRITNLFEGP